LPKGKAAAMGLSPPDAIGPHDGVEMRVYGSHDIGSACNRGQCAVCTNQIDTLHTALINKSLKGNGGGDDVAAQDRCKNCNILSLRAALQWLPIAIAVRPVGEPTKRKENRGGDRCRRPAVPALQTKENITRAGLIGGQNLSGLCTQIQRISCTIIIDALHTQRPVFVPMGPGAADSPRTCSKSAML
jgi:hypothetical protein